jgi:hypothetical protein
MLLGFAQAAKAEDCRDLFADLRWTLTEVDSFWQLASDHAGTVLLGTTCDPVFIKSWFSTAGWTLKLDEQNEPEEFGPPDGLFWQDKVLIFCLPRQWPWRWVTDGCSAGVNVSLSNGRITHISAGARI